MKRDRTDYIAISSTNTEPTEDLNLKALDLRDRKRGFFECIYHFLIKRDGDIEKGRDYENHAMGLGWARNALSVSICLVGGLGEPAFTVQQDEALKELVLELEQEYPEAVLKFNYDFPEADREAYERSLS